MRYRRLGRSGAKVSKISLGTNNFGAQVDRETSFRLIKKAVDLGVNSFDSANIYTDGKSEEIIGEALKGNMGEMVIATKVGGEQPERPNTYGLSRKNIMRQVNDSLRRLNADHIDLYYLHRPDPETPMKESLFALNDLVRQGKVTYLGFSNCTIEQLREAEAIQRDHDLEPFMAVQLRYNVILRGIENDLLPHCTENGIGVLTYSPLMAGFLTGKYNRGSPPPEGSRGSFNPGFFERVRAEAHYEWVAMLSSLAKEVGLPLSKLALAWVIRNNSVTSTIVGASIPEQFEEDCLLSETKIPDDVLTRLGNLKVQTQAN